MIDISVVGVGVELFGDVPADLVGRRLVVEVDPPIGDSIGIRLVGDVKSTREQMDGATRVGVEYTDLSQTERQILRILELIQSPFRT
jgi:hypothetical protein